jgi:hypothetical protein
VVALRQGVSEEVVREVLLHRKRGLTALLPRTGELVTIA